MCEMNPFFCRTAHLINPMMKVLPRGTIGCKTGKTTVLPCFYKIEDGGSSGIASLRYGGLSLPGHARRAGGVPAVPKPTTERKPDLLLMKELTVGFLKKILSVEYAK